MEHPHYKFQQIRSSFFTSITIYPFILKGLDYKMREVKRFMTSSIFTSEHSVKYKSKKGYSQ